MPSHNHVTRDVKPYGRCEGCDAIHDHAKYKPRVASGSGEPLEVTIEIDENAGPDEIIAAMNAAAREAGVL